MAFQCPRENYCAQAVGIGLDHGHNSGLGREQRAIMAQIRLKGIEINLHQAVVLAGQTGLKSRFYAMALEQNCSRLGYSWCGILRMRQVNLNHGVALSPAFYCGLPSAKVRIKNHRGFGLTVFLGQEPEGFFYRGLVEGIAID